MCPQFVQGDETENIRVIQAHSDLCVQLCLLVCAVLNSNYCTYLLSKEITFQRLVGDQPDAQFFYIIRLFQSSTCFEQTRAHHQEVSCINTASGIVTLCKWPSGMQVEQELLDLHTGRPLTEGDYTRCCINTVDLLMMRTRLLETRRGLK